MKPLLIDELLENNNIQSEEKVTIDGNILTGYQIAKPLNYNEEYFSYKERIEMAIEVLKGKAIAVRYFCDMTEDEKSEYVKNKISKQTNNNKIRSEIKSGNDSIDIGK